MATNDFTLWYERRLSEKGYSNNYRVGRSDNDTVVDLMPHEFAYVERVCQFIGLGLVDRTPKNEPSEDRKR